ncbi:flagellar hook-associated protein [Oceanicola granulosus HTCC2516]|uniref:Flagellar hook-associated protein 1 n=1 Tax=Oceanicola granulosus (strain ATCC BAA-861 / DSM 15982 / KCTC 12143 / HTCC2516) TaxID=314256 RepID=Q2CJJ8_OCEGH|nr:flagellar hook-associated protein FlgK [Oceanicola granulosus]EAR53141.1 flagellar hook-associated protein [Oceanicola granulosus HTCC2516]
MSIATSIGSALSGLEVASRRAEIVSGNIANALTEGYGRRSLAVSSTMLGGVRADGVIRHADRGIAADRRSAEADMEANAAQSDILDRLQRLFGEPGEPGALSSRLTAVEQALVSAAADPSSDIRLGHVADRLTALTGALNHAGDSLQEMRTEADRSIATQVASLNRQLERVETLNGEITSLRARGVDVSPLLDERQKAVDGISALVPVREIVRENDAIALMTLSGATLLDGKAREIGFSPVNLVTADMTHASGALSGLTIAGDPVTGSTAYGKLGGGRLGSTFDIRDTILPDVSTGLDAFARDLADRFADPATDPTLAAGAPGLLTDAGAALDPLDTPGLASRIALNPTVDPGNGGSLARLRDGLGETSSAPVGSSTQIERWLDALQDSRRTDLGGSAASASGHMASLLADVGSRRYAIEQDLAFETARWEVLKSAELANGVDTDRELQELLLIEQAYAANAKVLQTVNSVLTRLLEI